MGGEYDKCVILRHDVDNSLPGALELAKIEHRLGIKSTYFILLSSDFYNPFSKKNRIIIDEMIVLGHTIGLHFDETVYPDDYGNVEKTIKNIKQEIDNLSKGLGGEVKCFSYHRPSKNILDSNIEIEGLINSYGNSFFKDFKYLSDSRRHWREPALNIIESGTYSKLHILTHPFWYQKTDLEMKDTIVDFIKAAALERFETFEDNFTNLREIISEKDIIQI